MPKDSFLRLVRIVKTLRGKKGCPWDKKQKIKDVKNYLLEELYELFEVLDKKDFTLIKEEIGDLFFLLIFLCYLFEEKKIFNVREVLDGISEKMVSRHPHVFSSQKIKTSKEVLNRWVKAKSKKKKRITLWERIPKESPSLFSSYLFLRELKALGMISKKELEYRLLEVLSKFRKRKDKKILMDLIFYSSALLSYLHQNPELLLRKKVKKEASNFFYDAQDRKEK